MMTICRSEVTLMTTTTEYIDPNRAAWLLAGGGKNRALVQGHADNLARQMASGLWANNGQSIVLGADGRVLDGQHRLTAIVKSGIGQTFVVVRGVDESAITTMDTGRARAASDVLSMHGYANARSLAAAVRVCMFYDRRGVFSGDNLWNLRVSPTETLAYVQGHPDVVDALQECRPYGHLLGIGLVSGVFALVARKYGLDAARRAVKAMDGIGLSETDAMYHFRRRVDAGLSLRDWRAFVLFVKAFVMQATGSPCKQLRWTAGEEVRV